MILSILWANFFGGLLAIRFILAPASGSSTPATSSALSYLPLLPLFASVVVRIFFLPRFTTFKRALPVFVVGLATAEACGLLGIFISGAFSDTFVALSALMLLSYAPVFARRYT
jgi:hypothetical protein